jgi:C4-dicarboxylate transporter DctM subunit
MGVLLLTVGMIVFMLIGAPIWVSITLAGTVSVLTRSGNLSAIISRLYNANDNFPLMAIPFFFLAGELMLQGGIAKRIVDFSRVFLVQLKESLAVITFVACAFFGAISGSSYATTATIGKIMYPEMCKDGYKADFAAALQAVGGTLGVLIPPSILCVIYGVATGSSVGDMFLWITPVGIFTMFVYIFTAIFLLRRTNKNDKLVSVTKVIFQKPSLKIIFERFKGTFWALLTPVIILGGIYAGIFTPTECAIVSVVYAWLVGMFIYKELNTKTTINAILNASLGSASVIIIVDAANFFSWCLTLNNVGTSIANIVQNNIHSAIIFLLAVNVTYIIAGMFVEGSVTITIITPLLFPIAVAFGINPIHFGVITILSCIIGTLTPPFGGAVFVTAGFTQIPVSNLFKEVTPFFIAGFVATFIVTYFPFLWLY